MQLTDRFFEEGDPAFSGRKGNGLRNKEGTGCGTGMYFGYDSLLGGVRDKNTTTRLGGELGRFDLCHHTPGGLLAFGTTCHGPYAVVNFRYNWNKVTLSLILHQAGNSGQDDEQVGLDEAGNQRTQDIVIPELDLVGADSVVLIDHRDNAERKEFFDRVPYSEMTVASSNILPSQENLGRHNIPFHQGILPSLDETGLADGGTGLQAGEIRGPSGHLKLAHSHSDRTGRNDQHITTAFFQFRDLTTQGLDPVCQQLAVCSREGVRPDLYDNPTSVRLKKLHGLL
jgi:hypothetical protein